MRLVLSPQTLSPQQAPPVSAKASGSRTAWLTLCDAERLAGIAERTRNRAEEETQKKSATLTGKPGKNKNVLLYLCSMREAAPDQYRGKVAAL